MESGGGEAADGGAADTGTGGSGIEWGPAVSTVSAIAGLLLTLMGLKLGKLFVFGLLAAALLPWAAVSLRPAWRPLKYALACALTVAFTAFALTVTYYQGRHVEARATEAPHRPAPGGHAPHLKFLPVAGPIPHCVSFSGTGGIPAGHALVLFDRATDSGGHYTPTSTFSYDGQAAPSPAGAGWTAPDLDIGSGDAGDRGSHIAIVAVLVPQATADFLDALAGESDSGLLPPNVTSLGTTADRLVVVRNAQNAHC